MNRKCVLFNPKAGNNKCCDEIDVLWAAYDEVDYYDITRIVSYEQFFAELDETDDIILCGGDGTLNRFANDICGLEIKNDLYLYPVGSGNDFARDLGHGFGDAPNFRINGYLKNLPRVTVNGKECLFLNNVGFGIDGYCCEAGDKYRENGKKADYTAIAVKGLLNGFNPVNAAVTVDGVRHEFKNVWLAPTMFGRFYGGGMMPTPNQNRKSNDRTLSVMIMHGSGKLKTLMIFPKIFKGTHVKYKDYVEILTGKEITVEFDRLASVQIDGETVLNVTSYTAVID
ncbi:MAG: diacylglycerol kinase family protein [Oscillospiraceae bacterium]|nr:diacylglycerol kinase family protein [Oscillospiraceae bacterium]